MSRLFNIENIKFWLIVSYITIAPFWVLPGTRMYDSKRVLQIILFILLSFFFLFIVLRDSDSKKKLIISFNGILLACFLGGLGIFSSIFSYFPRFAFIELLIFGIILFCSIQLSVRYLIGHYYLGKFIYGLAIFFASVYLIYFCGNYIAAHLNPLVPMWPERVAVSLQIGETVYHGKEVLNFAHKRFFNHIQTWTLPLLISAGLYFKSNKIYRNLIWGLLLGWWMLVFASGARGTLVSCFIAAVVLLLLFRKRNYRFLGVAAGTAIAGFLLYLLMFKLLVPSESLPVARMTDSGRLDMWARALELWFSNPVIGVGPMHYAVLEEVPYFAHPHNFYLQLLSEWGVIAFLCFLALPIFYFLFLKKNFLNNDFEFKELSPRNNAVYMGFIGSAVAGFAHAGVSGVFHTPMSQIWAILIISWLVSLWNRKSDSENTISFKRTHLSIVFVFLVAGLLFLVSPDISRLDKNHPQYKEQFPNAKLYPRFWEQGLIYEEAPPGGSTTGQNSPGERNSPGD